MNMTYYIQLVKQFKNNMIILNIRMLLTYSDEIQKDIDNIIIQIKNGTLKENVNWGIHPTKCIAIPYRCKDTPLLTSNFLSVMLTIFLTLYYYISIKKYKITYELAIFINTNDIYDKLFNEIKPIILSKELLEAKLNVDNSIQIYKIIYLENYLLHLIN